MKIINSISKNKRISIPETYEKYELNSNEKIGFLIVCSLLLFLIGYVFYKNIILSAIFCLLSYPGLTFYSKYLAEKRSNELKEQFRDLIYSLTASISTGRHMAEALKESEQNMKLIYDENALIVVEIRHMVRRMTDYRESEEEILRDFATRSCNDDIANFVDIYFTCRETGGDLIKVLNKTSSIIIDKISIEKEIHTITVQKRFEAKILTAIPFVIIIFLQMISPDYLEIMYICIKGRIIMTAALVGIGFSYYYSMKLTKIDV